MKSDVIIPSTELTQKIESTICPKVPIKMYMMYLPLPCTIYPVGLTKNFPRRNFNDCWQFIQNHRNFLLASFKSKIAKICCVISRTSLQQYKLTSMVPQEYKWCYFEQVDPMKSNVTRQPRGFGQPIRILLRKVTSRNCGHRSPSSRVPLQLAIHSAHTLFSNTKL